VSKHFTTKSVEVPKCRNAKLRNAVSTKAVVTAVGHIVEELSSCFGVSGTATWKVEKPNNRIVRNAEMRNKFRLSPRSQPLVTSAEDGGRS
jgi:hypothetical protein